MRVLKWIIGRCKGKISAVECPIGWRPRYKDMDWNGLESFTREDFNNIMMIETEPWKAELLGHSELFEKPMIKFPKNFFLCGSYCFQHYGGHPKKSD
jgi:phosphoenolpyruvate carboxykinase (GTP)